MRIAIFNGAHRWLHDTNRLVRDGLEFSASDWDRALTITGTALVDGEPATGTVGLRAGQEIEAGDHRILVEYDGPLPVEPPLAEREAELLQRIAEGDDDAAVVLADHWGDERGAFIAAQRAGVAAAPDARAALLQAANFPSAWAGGFALPLLVDDGEPLEACVHRVSPRYYRRGATVEAIADARICEAVGVAPRGELGRFALKFPAPDEEIAMIARFDHPHLVRYAGRVNDRGGPGIAMHWAGGSFELGVPPDHELARSVGRQLCRALRELARLRITHDAIDPSHVVMHDGHVTLVGFGTASRPSDELTMCAGRYPRMGRYYSPERVRELMRTPTSDLYSVAGLLVEIATGVHPFLHDDAMRSLGDIALGRPNIVGDSPIERLARRTLVADPAARPTLDEFEATLG